MSSPDDFEHALWSNAFYSSPAVLTELSSSNHLNTLKKSVNMASLPLSRLLAAHLAASDASNDTENIPLRTSLMKVSPSMKALESKLNAPKSAPPQTIIEDDELVATPAASAANTGPAADGPSANTAFFDQPGNRVLALSLATFHTAKSSDTLNRMPTNTSSVETVQHAVDDATPRLDGANHTSSFYSTLNDDDIPPSSPSTHTADNAPDAVFSQSGASRHSSQSSDPQVKSKRYSRLVPAANAPSGPALPPKDTSRARANRSALLEPAQPPLVPEKPPQKVRSMLDAPFVAKKTADLTQDTQSSPSLKKSSVFGTPQSNRPAARTPESTKQAQADAAMPREPVRSSTMGDLGRLAALLGSEKPVNTKRFTFRGLFKIKSKNHSLSKLKDEDPDEPSKPVKILSKSFSTLNLASFLKKQDDKNQKPAPAKPKKLFGRRKSEVLQPSALPNLQAQPEPKVDSQPQISASPVIPAYKDSATIQSYSPVMPQVQHSATKEPHTPMQTQSVFSTDTPATDTLNPKEQTIREVEDSDYLPNLDDTAEFDINPPEIRETRQPEQESPYFLQNYLDSPPEIGKSDQFGSPFAVTFEPEKTKRDHLSPSMTPSSIAPRSPARSSRSFNEQLVGEALFPKSLDAHEVESIVSLERSRSMKSIRSNKRSSFLNYNGSDENIILGGDVGVMRQGSMKRSGSILKSSLSLQSLRAEVMILIDNAFDDVTDEPDSTQENHSTLSAGENYGDFIEFTDFIDIDDLDFSNSPLLSPEMSQTAIASPPPEDTQQAESAQSEYEFGLHLLEEYYRDGSSANSPQPPLTSNSEVVEEPEVVVVVSASSPEVEPAVNQPSTTPESPRPLTSDSPLSNAYTFAMEGPKSRDAPVSGPRPISMSFKGFNGSAFKDKQLVASGSHQLMQMDLDSPNDSSAVGQGFGSSDEDDSDEDLDSYANYFDQAASKSQPKKPESAESRRQQHMKQVLDLQPPPSSMPFHHNRIPSISDHSNTSSPKLLSSFISKMRKSPMGLPKVTPSRATVKFSLRIVLYDTYHHDEYDRHPEIATCNQLTPMLAQQIKEELNELKATMEVHEDSICYTQFF